MNGEAAVCVLDALKARLLAEGGYESLWHLERMNDAELAIVVAREVADHGSPHARDETVAA